MSDQSPWWSAAPEPDRSGPGEETAVLSESERLAAVRPDHSAAVRPDQGAHPGVPGPRGPEPVSPPLPAEPHRANDLVAPRSPWRHPAAPLVAIALISTLVGTLLAVLTARPGPRATADSSPLVVTVPRSQITAQASSTQTAEGDVSYGVANTLDGDPSTAWNSNSRADGKGPGMTLTYTFDRPVALRTITVLNGYQKVISRKGRDLDLFTANERVHEMTVVTDGGSWAWPLDDVRTQQTLSRDFGDTRTVTFRITSVYENGEFNDLALSEVSFAAAGGDAAAPGSR